MMVRYTIRLKTGEARCCQLDEMPSWNALHNMKILGFYQKK